MAAVPAEYKRLFLRSLKWDSEETGDTLYNTLKTAARARISETKNGKVLIGVSANRKDATYHVPALSGGMTPADLASLCEELIGRHSEASSFLVARGMDDPTDDQIVEEMLLLLQPVRSVSSDFSNLRS